MSTKTKKNGRLPFAQWKAARIAAGTWEDRSQGKANSKTKVTRAERDQGRQRAARVADEIVKKSGGSGTNPLAVVNHVGNSATASIAVPNSRNLMKSVCFIAQNSIANVAMGIVLTAIRNGFASAVSTGDGISPVSAWKYIIETLMNAFQGQVPNIQEAPVWFWNLIHAVRPKVGRVRNGRTQYTTKTSAAITDFVTEYPLGPGINDFAVYWGYTDTFTDVNGYPQLQADGNPYTTERGVAGFVAMLAFLPRTKYSRMIADPGTKADLAHDVSAFAENYAILGTSLFAAGAPVTQLQNESHITAPLLSKFVEFTENSSEQRGFTDTRFHGGGGCYLGARMVEIDDPQRYFDKKPPTFCYFNFDRFVQVAAFIFGSAMEKMQAVQTSSNPPTVYPLTIQDFKILLRQTLIPFFWNHVSQDIRFDGGTSNGTQQTMFPFVVGPNGYSIGGTKNAIKMPRVFTEHIRAIQREMIQPKGQRDCIDFVPILARPVGQIAPSQYLYWNGAAYVPVFTVDGAEVPIDIVDCSFATPQPGYVTFESEKLAVLAEAHNNFMNEVSTVCTSLCPITQENGIACLNPVYYTSYTRIINREVPVPVVPQTDPLSKGSKAVVTDRKNIKGGHKHIGSEFKRTKASLPIPDAGSDYLDYFTELSMFSVQPELKSLAKYLDLFVMPEFMTNESGQDGSGPAFQTYVTQTRTVDRTTYMASGAIAFAEKTAYQSLVTRDLMLAQLDIHNVLSGVSDVESELDALGKIGKGGFLSGIAAALGSAFLGPEAGAAISGVVGSLGL